MKHTHNAQYTTDDTQHTTRNTQGTVDLYFFTKKVATEGKTAINLNRVRDNRCPFCVADFCVAQRPASKIERFRGHVLR